MWNHLRLTYQKHRARQESKSSIWASHAWRNLWIHWWCRSRHWLWLEIYFISSSISSSIREIQRRIKLDLRFDNSRLRFFFDCREIWSLHFQTTWNLRHHKSMWSSWFEKSGFQRHQVRRFPCCISIWCRQKLTRCFNTSLRIKLHLL